MMDQQQQQQQQLDESKRCTEKRLSPQSVEVLNDRNRQLERERRKLAASCELPQGRLVEDFYREAAAVGVVTTIEMTSQNVELLNRRNAAGDKLRTGGVESKR